ncbi:MAG: ATP-binding protein [Acidobacteriota bacterium]|nr:ATP-binding protein [Acidobacteriota bacterium]
MSETITIKSFGGLKNVSIPLNSINIFIGKQASGKSVTVKLIYFFRKVYEDIFDGLTENKAHKKINEDITARFNKYFPPESWSRKDFFIEYKIDEIAFNLFGQDQNFSFENISVEKKVKSNLKINSSKLINKISLLREVILKSLESQEVPEFLKKEPLDEVAKMIYQIGLGKFSKTFGLQRFIPAGRSFFSNIQSSIFSILSSGRSFDPFLVEFGAAYENTKNDLFDSRLNKPQKYIQDSLSEILGAKFDTNKAGDYLIHKDGRKINLLFCSSGQQEALPLAIILENMFTKFMDISAIYTLYIEEPEAHLFPSAQKKIVELIATAYNLSNGMSQMFITTHSPYILTSFNNLLQAGELLEKGVSKRKLFKIVPQFEVLKPRELNAYAFADGDVKSLIDEETGLISADLLDEVSEEIAIEFDQLLNL